MCAGLHKMQARAQIFSQDFRLNLPSLTLSTLNTQGTLGTFLYKLFITSLSKSQHF